MINVNTRRGNLWAINVVRTPTQTAEKNGLYYVFQWRKMVCTIHALRVLPEKNGIHLMWYDLYCFSSFCFSNKIFCQDRKRCSPRGNSLSRRQIWYDQKSNVHGMVHDIFKFTEQISCTRQWMRSWITDRFYVHIHVNSLPSTTLPAYISSTPKPKFYIYIYIYI